MRTVYIPSPIVIAFIPPLIVMWPPVYLLYVTCTLHVYQLYTSSMFSVYPCIPAEYSLYTTCISPVCPLYTPVHPLYTTCILPVLYILCIPTGYPLYISGIPCTQEHTLVFPCIFQHPPPRVFKFYPFCVPIRPPVYPLYTACNFIPLEFSREPCTHSQKNLSLNDTRSRVLLICL